MLVIGIKAMKDTVTALHLGYEQNTVTTLHLGYEQNTITTLQLGYEQNKRNRTRA